MIDRITDNREAQHGSLPFQGYELLSAGEASLIRFRQFADTAKSKRQAPYIPNAAVCVVEVSRLPLTA
jgi:hypothetical protein